MAGGDFSAGGDFNTAPALSPFFNKTLARLLTELVDVSLAECAPGSGAWGRASVVELGGGEGHLAEGILRYWQSARPELRETIAYRIVEVGAGLRQRQAAAVAEHAAAGWDVGWGRDLADACAGTRPMVIVGNEFLDAAPAHVVDVGGGALREAYVEVDSSSLVRTWGEVSAAAADEIELLFGARDARELEAFTEDGTLELFPALGELMRQVAGVMPSGSLVNVDYGEWFPGVSLPGEGWGLDGRARRRRTVRGYFKHQLVLDPLARAGRQDLTADVDFAAVDLHGGREGFETVLLTTLGAFLRGGGAEDELGALRAEAAAGAMEMAPAAAAAAPASHAAPPEEVDPLEADRQATVLEKLLDEGDLGGAFKLMVQVRE